MLGCQMALQFRLGVSRIPLVSWTCPELGAVIPGTKSEIRARGTWWVLAHVVTRRVPGAVGCVALQKCCPQGCVTGRLLLCGGMLGLVADEIRGHMEVRSAQRWHALRTDSLIHSAPICPAFTACRLWARG